MAMKSPDLRYARPMVSPKVHRACALAAEIETLLADLSPEERDCCGYQLRLAQGMTRSLIDQLDELDRGPSSARKIAAS